MSYWLHEEADAELGDAAAFYAEHASRAVAEAFLTKFARLVASIELNQQLGTPREDGMQIHPFRRFPYSLVYRENESAGPQIHAVAHQSRKPECWLKRV